MDIFLLILSFVFMIVGIIGSVIPVLPGPLSSWLGLFIFSNISNVQVESKILIFCLIIGLIIFVLDYIIPIYTSKKFGASKFGIIGASIGTLIGLFLPPFGIIIGALIGGQIVFAIPKHLLQGIIGIFVIYTLWGPAVKAIRSSFITFVGVGAFASFATMFVGGTGPLIAPFIKASTTERQMPVATHGAFMSWQHGIKIIKFGLLGLAFGPYIILMVAMILFGIFGTWSGKTILNWMPEHIFKRAFNTVLALLAIRLLYEALKGYFF